MLEQTRKFLSDSFHADNISLSLTRSLSLSLTHSLYLSISFSLFYLSFPLS